MRRIILLAALVLLLSPTAGSGQGAQVDLRIDVGLPAVPPLVVVQPGIQVVENHDEEVFYTRGYYWARRGPYWYRARRPGAPFMLVERRRVPPGLARLPPGQYRHWRKGEMKEARREQKAERKAWKEYGKGDRGRGHDHHGD